MSKKKAISLLVIILALVLVCGVFAVTPMQIGNLDYTPPLQNIPLGIELSGGVYVVYDVSVPNDSEGNPMYDESDLDTNIQATIDILQNRLFAAGYTEATVVESGTNSIRVEVADVSTGNIDSSEIMDILGKPAVLEFRKPDGTVVLSGQKGHITDAFAYFDGVEYGVSLEFSTEGTKKFAEATGALIGQQMGIYLDGVQISNPSVGAAITEGKAQISGSFTAETAEALAVQIQGGSLPVILIEAEQSSVSATLGESAVTSSIFAGLIGLLIIFAFMIFVYKGLGLIADLALVIYTIIVIYVLGVLPVVQLSLAGIAGIVLSIGMAVDANVIIFERIKDEFSTGKALSASINAGYKRATSAIIDANITTIIAAAVLYFLGSATIKAFAITLFVGIVVSLFTSMIVTRSLTNIFVALKGDNKFYGLKSEVSINE